MIQPRRGESRGVTGVSIVLARALSNLSKTGRTGKQLISILCDGICCLFALWMAYTLRLGSAYTGFESSWHIFLSLVLISVGVLLSFGIYRWEVRSSTTLLTLQLMKAAIVSSLGLLILLFLFPPAEVTPRSLFAIYGLIFFACVTALRLTWQLLLGAEAENARGEPVAIYGAGSAGRQLVQLMSLSPDLSPTLFIDDNPAIQGTRVRGLKVFHGKDPGLQSVLKNHEIARIVVAVPSAKGNTYAKILEDLSRYELPVQTIPSISEIVDGGKSPDEIRDISVEDILGRSQVLPDPVLLRKRVEGKTVLVTGGGGSIGSEICRQIVKLSVGTLIVFDQSESNLYQISEEIIGELARYESATTKPREAIRFFPVLGSVLDQTKLEKVFSDHVIDTVFHAAAYKHVPIVEKFPEEGIRVNVFGTHNVLECAVRHETEAFVLISTDKAVRPSNTMGATKRVAELILQARAQQVQTTDICMVRFGNVLGSSGSVVPKFSQQISNGRPVTITHEDITRYFMTIPEASQLVLQASSLARGGEVFVLDMGEPVKIMDLAVKLIKLHGRQVATDKVPDGIQIEVTGLRPGEKLHEELFISGEETQTGVAKILREQYQPHDATELDGRLSSVTTLLENGNYEQARRIILDLAMQSTTQVMVNRQAAVSRTA